MTQLHDDLASASSRRAAAVAAARLIAASARRTQQELDVDGAFPAAEVRALAEHGLLAAPLPVRWGGAGLLERDGSKALALVLSAIGAGSLPLGRLYEGHVNAIGLILAYGRIEQQEMFAAKSREGHLFAVWNTQREPGVRLAAQGAGWRLQGAKIFASGAGFVRYPLITARTEAGDLLMVIPDAANARVDLSQWRAHGMRASASGAVDFSDLGVGDDSIIGGPDDFHRQPMFSTGAWRFAAVQYGAVASLFDLARAHLVKADRAGDPHQLARLGAAAIAVETARLWVFEAATRSHGSGDPAASVAYVNLARLAVERAGLEALELAHRSVGLAAFLRPHPIERLSRDLATYLRQPAPDEALCEAANFLVTSPRPIAEIWENEDAPD
ncbi:acyl-CoA dehydrogenase domain protein [Methylocella silvestris BL2]|uniref:Acyl-CoA dehydrogenase domain protein n=1 Tax=Methylocella silvestris (strain DSM 15510 / CIP 108128 / LMG 27833 / NCIMB 13906 / BL2) TaxID=395965 RepID=B8EIY7_METSB|nr:acyl-CoA dehydrogenase family protein [Methylocella silvestris]ACK52479.1 acyl-CoA dehydrogenase domain protein [Methylocella silvestris BL2]